MFWVPSEHSSYHMCSYTHLQDLPACWASARQSRPCRHSCSVSYELIRLSCYPLIFLHRVHKHVVRDFLKFRLEPRARASALKVAH